MVSIHSSIGGEDTDGGDQPGPRASGSAANGSGPSPSAPRPVSKIGKHFADWCNMFLATNIARDQGIVTPKCAILTAVTGVAMQSPGHQSFILAVTGSQALL